MAKIKDGGTTENLKGRVESIRIGVADNERRLFEFWINDDSLSYLTLDEMLDLRKEINIALKKILLSGE